MRVLTILAALLLLGITGPEPRWGLTDASSIRAHHSKTGVEIVADVTLRNPCWEASIIVDPAPVVPAEYDVVARIQPQKVGVMCIQKIVPTTVRAWMPIQQQTITVHTIKAKVTVRVLP